MKTIGAIVVLAILFLQPGGGEALAQSGGKGAAGPGQMTPAAYERLFGPELEILISRTYETLDTNIPLLDSLWGTGRQPGPLVDQWTAAANLLYDDLSLYLNSSVDAANDALKDKIGEGTQSDIDLLDAKVKKTLDYVDHVVRKKGLEVATFRDEVQKWVDSLRGFKDKMPAVIFLLQGDLAYVRDTATRVRKRLDAGYETVSEITDDMLALDLAKRSLAAVKIVVSARRASVSVLMAAITPDIMASKLRKAADGWVTTDMGAGTFVVPALRATLEQWPTKLIEDMVEQYTEIYREGSEAVKPLVDATFHQTGSMESTSFEQLDKFLDPYIRDLKQALEVRKQVEDEQKEAEQDLKSMAALLDGLTQGMGGSGKMAAGLRAKMNEILATRLRHDEDRREYKRLGERFVELVEKNEELEKELQEVRNQHEELSEQASVKPERKIGKYPSSQAKVTLSLKARIRKLEKEIKTVVSEIEEVEESIDALRRRIQGT